MMSFNFHSSHAVRYLHKNSLFPVADQQEYSISHRFFQADSSGSPPYLSEISTFEKKSIHGRLPPPAG